MHSLVISGFILINSSSKFWFNNRHSFFKRHLSSVLLYKLKFSKFIFLSKMLSRFLLFLQNDSKIDKRDSFFIDSSLLIYLLSKSIRELYNGSS